MTTPGDPYRTPPGASQAISDGQYATLPGLEVRDASGAKIGHVGQVFTIDATGRPEWVTVTSGIFGTRENFAPLHGATVTVDGLVLPVAQDVVRDAPSIDNDGQLTQDEIARLYSHYNTYLPQPPTAGTVPVSSLQRYVVTEETRTRQVGKDRI